MPLTKWNRNVSGFKSNGALYYRTTVSQEWLLVFLENRSNGVLTVFYVETLYHTGIITIMCKGSIILNYVFRKLEGLWHVRLDHRATLFIITPNLPFQTKYFRHFPIDFSDVIENKIQNNGSAFDTHTQVLLCHCKSFKHKIAEDKQYISVGLY